MTLEDALDAIEKRFVDGHALFYQLTFSRVAVAGKRGEITGLAQWKASVTFRDGPAYVAFSSEEDRPTRLAAAADVLESLERSRMPRKSEGKYRE